VCGPLDTSLSHLRYYYPIRRLLFCFRGIPLHFLITPFDPLCVFDASSPRHWPPTGVTPHLLNKPITMSCANAAYIMLLGGVISHNQYSSNRKAERVRYSYFLTTRAALRRLKKSNWLSIFKHTHPCISPIPDVPPSACPAIQERVRGAAGSMNKNDTATCKLPSFDAYIGTLGG
jgi:hypothetical protein